jgi:hypothetical protein
LDAKIISRVALYLKVESLVLGIRLRELLNLLQQVRSGLDPCESIERVIGSAAESIGHDIGFAWPVMDIQVKLLEQIEPVGLAAVERGLSLNVLGGPVVRIDLHPVPIHKVVPPALQHVHD